MFALTVPLLLTTPEIVTPFCVFGVPTLTGGLATKPVTVAIVELETGLPIILVKPLNTVIPTPETELTISV
jgi:hypothetical protein